jgi:hypothetical protein
VGGGIAVVPPPLQAKFKKTAQFVNVAFPSVPTVIVNAPLK